jgi:hypothetical protein
LVKNNRLTLTGSRFTHCGHARFNGGAIWHSDRERTINNCCFDRCLGWLGGAICVNRLTLVDKCEFIACQSLALQDKQAGDVAVYANAAVAPTAISGCVFRQTSLVIGDAHDVAFRDGHYVSEATFVRSTQFQQGSIYYHNKSVLNTIARDCSFSGGDVIKKSFG